MISICFICGYCGISGPVRKQVFMTGYPTTVAIYILSDSVRNRFSNQKTGPEQSMTRNNCPLKGAKS
ncbi:MAG: hypothetical protein CMN76_17010 [Spirochaetaceae bacterium]|nr:hypothetical protein [Spirochaetaceae bacterium]